MKEAHKANLALQALASEPRSFHGVWQQPGLNIYKYSYPAQRSVKDAKGVMKGQAGSVELLNSKVISTQPRVSMEPGQRGLACMACLDQTVRVNVTPSCTYTEYI